MEEPITESSIGDTVRFPSGRQLMTITKYTKRWFREDTLELIYQVADKRMTQLSNVAISCVEKVE